MHGRQIHGGLADVASTDPMNGRTCAIELLDLANYWALYLQSVTVLFGTRAAFVIMGLMFRV